MVSHKYTRERLYNLQYAPLSKVAPENLYEEVMVSSNSKASSGGGKTFVASTKAFADVINVKYEKGKEKSEERRERKPKVQKEEDTEFQKFQNWENAKFSDGLKWGGDAPPSKKKGGAAPPAPVEPAKTTQPRSHVDELFAGASSSQPATTPAPAQPRGGSKFMKHFKQSDEPDYSAQSASALHSGGTEQEIIKQFMGSASNVQTLDAASFEKELIAASVQSNSPPARRPVSSTQGFVDAASLEKALLQSSLSTQPPAPTQQNANQSGTFDAANLEAQLLANVTGGSSHAPQQQQQPGGLPPLLAMQQQQQRNRLAMGYTGQPGRPGY